MSSSIKEEPLKLNSEERFYQRLSLLKKLSHEEIPQKIIKKDYDKATQFFIKFMKNMNETKKVLDE